VKLRFVQKMAGERVSHSPVEATGGPEGDFKLRDDQSNSRLHSSLTSISVAKTILLSSVLPSLSFKNSTQGLLF
jgi:hypothetical protein